MDIFETLFAEHRLIERVVTAFERHLDGARDDPAWLRGLSRFAVFFREFADLVHHEREESVLFPALARHDFSLERGPLAHLRHEHDAERRLVVELLQAALGNDLGADTKLAHAVGVGRELVAFQRRHMQKENELLYPQAMRELGAESPELLVREISEFQEDLERHGHLRWLLTLGEELAGGEGHG